MGLLRRNAVFRRFFVGQAVSYVGDQITLIALPLLAVLVLDASAAQVGLLVAAETVPNLLLSLHAGAWVDRRGQRRRVMLVADVVRALALSSVGAAYWLGSLTLLHLYAVAAVTGSASVFFLVAQSTLFVSMVERDDYVEASSRLNGARAASFISGPSLGGLLVQLVSAPAALLVDAGTFVVSAAALASIAPVEPPPEAAERGHLLAGLRFVRRQPLLGVQLVATAWINLFNFAFWALLVVFATRELGLPAGELGLVLGAASFGGLLGSFVTAPVTRRIGPGPAIVLGCLVFTLPLLLVPAAGGPRWLVLGCVFTAELLSGLGVMLLDINAAAVRAALVPDALRARVSGAYMVVNYGVRPLGAVLGGALGSAIGLRPTLWIATGGAALGALAFVGSPFPGLRELPEQAS